MAIMSYIVHPAAGKKEELINQLQRIPECEVFPAENQELLVLVTDTETEAEENVLMEKLNQMGSLLFLSMVYANNDLPQSARSQSL